MTTIQGSVQYYNAEAGVWEPFIETFPLELSLKTDKKGQTIFQCQCDTQITFNFTERLMKNMKETYK